MKRIFFLLLCFCFSVLSFAQRTNEAKQLTKQDSLRLQQLLSGQVEIVIDDETQKEIDRLFNPEKWKMKSTPFPKKNMKFETELPRYYISQVDTIDGRGYIRLLPYGPFETPEEEQIYVAAGRHGGYRDVGGVQHPGSGHGYNPHGTGRSDSIAG